MSALVTYRLDGAVAHIGMDDGKRNALSPDMLAQLNGALDRAEREARVVVLGGREGVFSAGFDLTVMKKGGAPALGMVRSGFLLSARLQEFPQPVVIACSGHALAAGAFLLLSADYRLGVEGAFKIGTNEVAIGITMPRAAVEICNYRVATTYLHRAVALAEIFAPADAVQAGFLDKLVTPEQLLDAAQQTALELTKLDARAHAETKRRTRGPVATAIRRALRVDIADSLLAVATREVRRKLPMSREGALTPRSRG